MTLAISALALLLTGVSQVEAQRPPNVPRIGVLGSGIRGAFEEGLRQFGYVEGKNITIEWRSASGQSDQFADVAAELVSLKVDVIVAANNPAIAAAQKATPTIPIVMVLATDPVSSGFVSSLGRPAGNVTGLSMQTPELAGKRLQLLKEAVPRLSRVAVLWDPTEPGRQQLVKEAEDAAASAGLHLQAFEARSIREIENAFAAMTKTRMGAVLVFGSTMLFANRAKVVELAARSRLPTMCTAREWMDAGFLISYGPSLSDMYRRAPYFVDRILNGARPADLPVEQPTRFELVINAKAAKALGLTIPPSLLVRAEHVWE